MEKKAKNDNGGFLTELEAEKMMLETKLDISEKRISFLFWFFGVIFGLMGIATPLLSVLYQDNRIDKQIENMKEK